MMWHNMKKFFPHKQMTLLRCEEDREKFKWENCTRENSSHFLCVYTNLRLVKNCVSRRNLRWQCDEKNTFYLLKCCAYLFKWELSAVLFIKQLLYKKSSHTQKLTVRRAYMQGSVEGFHTRLASFISNAADGVTQLP